VLATVNQRSLPKGCCLQRIYNSLLKLYCLQRIYDSLPKVCVSHRICDSLLKLSCLSELTFATKKVLVAVGQRWLPKGCCLQRVSVRCWKCVFCSEFVIRCWNWVVCNELTFAVESVLATTSQRSLLKGCFQIELSTANEHSLLKVCWLQQTSFRCQIM